MSRGLACLKCKVFLVPKKNEVYVEEMVSATASEPAQSYKLWMADLAVCPSCGFELLMGFGNDPIREVFAADYKAFVASSKPITQIEGSWGYRP